MNTQLAKVLYEFAAGPASEPWDTWDTIKEDQPQVLFGYGRLC